MAFIMVLVHSSISIDPHVIGKPQSKNFKMLTLKACSRRSPLLGSANMAFMVKAFVALLL
jgi:hypothetical protein